jgi:hypothetical protein
VEQPPQVAKENRDRIVERIRANAADPDRLLAEFTAAAGRD